ncbi:MAG: alpha/beta fold hydrolase [Flavobacteriales bacterium]|jgi:putative phosphoribosyl transferase|nr:MAG: alpha/beta fold hydrolase [Flavobacteriales bacterium]
MTGQEITIDLTGASLQGTLTVPAPAKGLVLFCHGSGSSRHSPRNRLVAAALQREGFATFLFDLLMPEEDEDPEARFDIPLLTQRLIAVVRWTTEQAALASLPLGLFGASTGAASALGAAAALPGVVKAVVSRGGRPDMAEAVLPMVEAPTLLVVGGWDEPVIGLNRFAFDRLQGVKELVIVPEATHLFEEPGKLDEVARLAAAWFARYLR